MAGPAARPAGRTAREAARSAALLATAATVVAVPALAPDRAAMPDISAATVEAGDADGLAGARALQDAVDALIAAPSPQALPPATDARIVARVPDQQTEIPPRRWRTG